MNWYLNRIRRIVQHHGLWLTALLTVGVFFGFFIFGDTSAILSALLTIERWRIGTVLGLATMSYAIRFLKWEYYFRELDIQLPIKTSLIVFFSGLMMVVTPGKAGEVWKGWFLHDLRGVPVSQTVSVVSAERITDLLALSAFATLGLVVFEQSSVVLVGVVVIFLLGIGLLQWRTFCLHCLDWLEILPIIGRYVHELETFYESTYTLFQFRPLGISLFLSLVAWGLEGVALWFVIIGFGAEATVPLALFVFGFGSIIGAVSLLPGGLAAAEASMVGMFVVLGYSRTIAVSSTLVIRVGTLWYGALLGTCIFLLYRFTWRRNQSTP